MIACVCLFVEVDSNTLRSQGGRDSKAEIIIRVGRGRVCRRGTTRVVGSVPLFPQTPSLTKLLLFDEISYLFGLIGRVAIKLVRRITRMKKGMWKSLATLTKTGKAKGKTLPDKVTDRPPKSARESEYKEKDEATVKPAEGPEQSCPRSNGRLTRCASMEDVSVVSSAFFTDAHATAEKGDEPPEWKHADVNRTSFADRRRKSKSVDISNLKGNLIIPPNNSTKIRFVQA